ncbi:MAG TPA: carboxypeptidase regulatory-like domain-containing protein [Candidatus Baltobacteraceae bacterium]|nr:carboxypeptidase regulatory-like domain-containing protein [Candidatus Baltobacteraceae bacterium]
MRRFLLTLLLAAFCPALALATGPAYIEGSVVNAQTGQPLAGVHVTLQGPAGSAAAVTDSRGFYIVWDAPVGQSRLTFSRDGFEQSAGFICLHPGSTNASPIGLHERLDRQSGMDDYAQWRAFQKYATLRETTNETWLGPC